MASNSERTYNRPYFIVGVLKEDGETVRDEDGRPIIRIEQRFSHDDANAAGGWLRKQGFWVYHYRGQELRWNSEAERLMPYDREADVFIDEVEV